MARGKSAKAGPNNICQNRRARHYFEIEDRLEAGIALLGTEVKACRARKVHLNDAYVQVMRGEAYLISGHIAEYEHGNRLNHDPIRTRKLLLHRREIDRLDVLLNQRGQSVVPLSMYFKRGRVKIELGVGRGKRRTDRRHDIKERETRIEMERALKRGRSSR